MAFKIEDGVLIEYAEEANVTDVTIPESVTVIGSGAFHDCETITNVMIPDSVKKIESSAFAGCSSLKNVRLPKDLDRVDSSVFCNCTSLESIVIPENVEKIQISAFYKCTSLKCVTIPSSVNMIGMMAFDETPWLENQTQDLVIGGSVLLKCRSKEKELFIPENITYISDDAFSECTSEIIHLPDSVTELEEGLFSQMHSLKKVTMSDKITYIPSQCFDECENLEEVTLPSSLQEIWGDAFYGCKKLRHLDLPNGLKEIEDFAFRYCESLEEIILPDSVKFVGQYAFSDCVNVRKFSLPNNDAEFGDSVFWNIPIDTLYIPSGFVNGSSISDGFIENHINKIDVAPDNPALTVHEGVLYSKDMTVLYKAPETIEQVIIPATITKIKRFAFILCEQLKEVKIPESVEKIGLRAFVGCKSLTNVKLPSGITEIAPNTFGGCTGLNSIELPEQLRQIGESAFYGCSSLESVVIPSGVNDIGYHAFADCENLINVVLPEKLSQMQFRFEKHETELFETDDTLTADQIIECAFSRTKWLKEKYYTKMDNAQFRSFLAQKHYQTLPRFEVKMVRAISVLGKKLLDETPDQIDDKSIALIHAADAAISVVNESGEFSMSGFFSIDPVTIDLLSDEDVNEISNAAASLYYYAMQEKCSDNEAKLMVADCVASTLMFEFWNMADRQEKNEKTPVFSDNCSLRMCMEGTTDQTTGSYHFTKLGIFVNKENGDTKFIDTLAIGKGFAQEDIELQEEWYDTILSTDIGYYKYRINKALGCDPLEEPEHRKRTSES